MRSFNISLDMCKFEFPESPEIDNSFTGNLNYLDLLQFKGFWQLHNFQIVKKVTLILISYSMFIDYAYMF